MRLWCFFDTATSVTASMPICPCPCPSSCASVCLFSMRVYLCGETHWNHDRQLIYAPCRVRQDSVTLWELASPVEYDVKVTSLMPVAWYCDEMSEWIGWIVAFNSTNRLRIYIVQSGQIRLAPKSWFQATMTLPIPLIGSCLRRSTVH